MTTTPTTPFDDETETLPTDTVPPADSMTYTQRVFRYAHHTIPDPGAHLSIEDVRRALVIYFPDLVQATTTTATEGDTLVVTFAKQTTRKGAESPPSVVHRLAQRLLALPPYRGALEELDLPHPLTLSAIASRRTAIDVALRCRYETQQHCQRILNRCLYLPPTPYLTQLPFGF